VLISKVSIISIVLFIYFIFKIVLSLLKHTVTFRLLRSIKTMI